MERLIAMSDDLSEIKTTTDNRLPIAELYPELNQAEQEESEYFLTRFLEIMHDIFQENQQKEKG